MSAMEQIPGMQPDGFHVTLPVNLGDGMEYREYIVTRAWFNGSGKPWCEAHYYMNGEKLDVNFWTKIEQLAEIAFNMGAFYALEAMQA